MDRAFQPFPCGWDAHPIRRTGTKSGGGVRRAVRAASCYGIRQVWFSGDRVRLDASKGYRLPHEERMRGYKDVVLHKSAVYTVLYDRQAKRVRAGLEERNVTCGPDFDEPDHMADAVGVTWGTTSRQLG
jgi:hypothetical protein